MAETLRNVELIFWNLEKVESPGIQYTRGLLEQNGFSRERAQDIPVSTAFRRAVKSLLPDSKSHLARFWTSKKDSLLHVQIDNEHENGDGRLHREHRATYRLAENTPTLTDGEAFQDMPTAFRTAQTTYSGADISSVIQAIVTHDGLGAYSPRKGGGIYFAPLSPQTPDLLDRLERFCSALGVRLLRYSVPDNAAQRAEVADAIAYHCQAELDAHAQAIGAYVAETTAPGICANRRAALDTTRQLIERLAPHMPAQRASLLAALDRLHQDLNAKETAIFAYRQAQGNAPRHAGRRIAGLFPQTPSQENPTNA
jgi:hypothetical protein